MGENYQYPVFFECHRLLGEENRRRVETHFRVHHKSGGGECGPLTRVAGDVYSIAFKYWKDQQEVLRRSEHPVDLTDGRQVFSVRGSLSPPTSLQETPPTAATERQRSIPDTPPSGYYSADRYGEEDGTLERRLYQLKLVGEVCYRKREEDQRNEDQNVARGAAAGAQKSLVQVEIVLGTIESQQTDAVVSPMVYLDPLSTRVGNILSEAIGPQVTERVRRKLEVKAIGDLILEEELTGVPFGAVFFLGLFPWDKDDDGVPVQILRMGINAILTSCESKGFGSVALPVLGVGTALQFPVSLVSRVLQEEICRFEQERTTKAPISVRIVLNPGDEEASEAFKSVEEMECSKSTENELKSYQDQGSCPKRIVLLGKTGFGKSHLANTILGEEVFTSYHTSISGTITCRSETRTVKGRRLTLIDTPGFFDTDKSEEELKPEIMRCLTECAPGPHVFLIVLKVDKFTKHEQEVISKICEHFSEYALNYAVIIFTHGDQLPEGMIIEEFVSLNKNLSDLVKKCGGRCHVFDNKYWNGEADDYRSNQFQLEAFLQTADKMMVEKHGCYYTNDVLMQVEERLQEQEKQIRATAVDLPPEEIREQAKTIVFSEYLTQVASIAYNVLLGAFFGVASLLKVVLKVQKR